MEIESKVTGSALTASEFNQIPDEMENLISFSGQTPSSSDLTQITQAVAQYVADGDYYSVSGTADAIVLSPISPRLAPPELTDGFKVRFQANYDNTGAVTVNVNNLGAKTVTLNGSGLIAGKIRATEFYVLIYSSNTDTFEMYLSGNDVENLFLKKVQISNCVLEAPNGVYSISNRNLTFKGGLKVLIPNGRNSDYSLKNIEYTLPDDVTVNYSSFSTGQRRVCFLTSSGSIVQCSASYYLGAYQNKSQIPTTLSSTAGHYAYANYENLWYYTSGSTTADWQPYYAVPIVPISTTSATAMSGIAVFSRPVKLADSNMVDGKWILKNIQLASDVTLPKTNNIDYSLEDYLPKDHFCYEVLVSATADCSTSGTHAMVYVETSLIDQAQICRIQGVANASVSGCSFVPIGLDRTIAVQPQSTLAGTFRLWIRGYRRMGLNG